MSFNKELDQPGPVIYTAAYDKGESRIVVVGNSSFVSQYLQKIYSEYSFFR